MPTPACAKNIAEKKSFPPCSDAYCWSISFGLGVHCTEAKPPLNPDEPVGPQFDPNRDGQGRPGYCYCCCSCFGATTPIEVSPGEFSLARDIVDGELVLAAGADLDWQPRRVESASTWVAQDGLIGSMYYLRYSWTPEGGGNAGPEAGETWREVMVSPDHPFLMEDGTIVAVQDLTKKDLRLRRADGGVADVLVVAQGSLVDDISTIQMEGDFDGTDLTGHLLNTNGIVSADFKVQVWYASGHLADGLTHDFPDDRETIPVGTPEYEELFPNPAYTAFVEDPSQWPLGFVPAQRREINVPATARRYLTDDQARDVRRNGEFRAEGNTYPSRSLLYLFGLARGLYPDVDFLLDWDNRTPNAYTWSAWGRQTIVVTGGMVRLTEMGRDGLWMIVAAMLAYGRSEVSCVGEADYAGVAFVSHTVWDDALFVTVVDAGLKQVRKLFDLVDDDDAGPDPADPCRGPGLDCRLKCYEAALSLFPVPACAQRKPPYFELQDARAISLTSVQLTFSRSLDVPTAETVGNYVFDPAVEAASATVPPETDNLVLLDTSELDDKTTYVVRVSNVVSNDLVPLNPRHDTGAFTTP
jgi:hypothetical protein